MHSCTKYRGVKTNRNLATRELSLLVFYDPSISFAVHTPGVCVCMCMCVCVCVCVNRGQMQFITSDTVLELSPTWALFQVTIVDEW